MTKELYEKLVNEKLITMPTMTLDYINEHKLTVKDIITIPALAEKYCKFESALIAEPVVEEPVDEAAVKEPVVEATVEEPVVEPTVEEPVVEPVVEAAVEEIVVDETAEEKPVSKKK